MYDPTLGRWLEEDTEGFDAGDPNSYRFVKNDPTDATDPSGLEAIVRQSATTTSDTIPLQVANGIREGVNSALTTPVTGFPHNSMKDGLNAQPVPVSARVPKEKPKHQVQLDFSKATSGDLIYVIELTDAKKNPIGTEIGDLKFQNFSVEDTMKAIASAIKENTKGAVQAEIKGKILIIKATDTGEDWTRLRFSVLDASIEPDFPAVGPTVVVDENVEVSGNIVKPKKP